MSIYVDKTFYWPNGVTDRPVQVKAGPHRRGKTYHPTAKDKKGCRMCHMWCDDGEEEVLHALAAQIGLLRAWFQEHRFLRHYDLTPSKQALAIAAGALEMNLVEWLKGRGK